jgi:hypothetical protein
VEQWGFLGGSAQKRSTDAGAEMTRNWMRQLPDSRYGRPWMTNTPGLTRFLIAPVARRGARGLFSEDGRAFAGIGSGFYELFEDGSALLRGLIANTNGFGRPITISSNGLHGGAQLFITASGRRYIYDLDADTLTLITVGDLPGDVVMGAYLDGYFLVLCDDGTFAISGLNDGTSWSALDQARRSTASDQTLAIITDHREAWLFGEKTTEPWYNSGNNDFPLEPSQSSFITQGIYAPFTAVMFDNSPMWVGGDGNGAGIVYRAQGYTPIRVSNHALEARLRDSTQLARSRAWTYQEDGHSFYVLQVPDLDTTPVYDVTTNEWHERAHWNPTQLRWERYVGNCHCFAFGKHLVGDRQSGMIYEQSITDPDMDVEVF